MGHLEDVKTFQNLFTKYQKTIPDKYNQIELMRDFMNKDIDFYISISNRSDGKSFNYIGFLMYLAIKQYVPFMLISRHFTLRNAYVELVENIAIESKLFNADKISYHRTQDYVIMKYDDLDLCVITDLNNATDLKYHSAMLKFFPIIVFDEFLALQDDYLIDEWDKLKTIYESIDRNTEPIPFISFPKIILLGNAVNFDSPILANLNIFEKLQKQKIGTKRQYDNILVEMRRNVNANERRNTRAFQSEQDAMTTGEFMFNHFNLSDDNLKNHIASNGDYYYIKTKEYYIKVSFNVDDLETNIKVVPFTEHYEFCTHVKDVKDNVMYLELTEFYDELHEREYYNQTNLHFDNAFTKNYILNSELIELRINMCTSQYLAGKPKETQTDKFSRQEKIYKDNYRERTLKYLSKQFEI